MRFPLIVLILLILGSCRGINKVMKNKDPEYKLRMAEKYYVKKKYNYANDIIYICRNKPETKDYSAARLYYNLGQFMAASVAFEELLNNYPESDKAEDYKFMSIKSYYRFAEMSIQEKRSERFEKVIAA